MNRHSDKGWSCRIAHASMFLNFMSSSVQERLGPADIIIFQRNVIIPQFLDAITYWQALGKSVLIDLDDAYHILPKSNPAHEFWHQREHVSPDGEIRKGGAIEMLFEGLKLSNGLVSPNRLLREELAWAAGNTYQLNNYAEPEWWTDLPTREELKKERGLEDKIVIGWGGSTSHMDGWTGSGIRKALERVCNRHPEVVVLICGSNKYIVEHLKISGQQKMAQSYVLPAEWPKTVSMFDIGVAPLYDFYDQHRSDIKTMEYSLGAVPWIATDGVVYESWNGWGAGHLGPENWRFWEDALEYDIKNLKERQEIAASLVPVAQERCFIDNNLDKWAGVIEQAIKNFQSTNALLPNVVWVKHNRNGTGDEKAEIEDSPKQEVKPETPSTVVSPIPRKLKIKRQKVETMQKRNLEFSETWLHSLPKIAGVDVALCLSYNLVQLLNKAEAEWIFRSAQS